MKMEPPFTFPATAIHNHRHKASQAQIMSTMPYSPSKLGLGTGGGEDAARSLRHGRSDSGGSAQSHSSVQRTKLHDQQAKNHNHDVAHTHHVPPPIIVTPQKGGYDVVQDVSSDEVPDHHKSLGHSHSHSRLHTPFSNKDIVAPSHAQHAHSYGVERCSRMTATLLPYVERWPIIHSIMLEKDSRRLLYFLT
jgi:zinc transporter 5/7